MGKDFVINEGDGAFYGPKLDFHLADSLGRTWQCGTIQLDMQMPERFELEYTGADGEKHRPVMIHRVVLGSIERFIGVITEHFAGAFPAWLSPVQVKVLPVTDRAAEYADQVAAQLDQQGFRVEVDHTSNKLGYKIRSAQGEKVPYMLIVGDKDVENGTVSVSYTHLDVYKRQPRAGNWGRRSTPSPSPAGGRCPSPPGWCLTAPRCPCSGWGWSSARICGWRTPPPPGCVPPGPP